MQDMFIIHGEEEADRGLIDEDPTDILQQLDTFDKMKFGEQDLDSD